MKKFLSLLALVAVFATALLLTGCDPEKTGGGGKPQPYDSSTGQYK